MVGKIKGEGAKTTYWIDGVQVTKARFNKAFQPVRVETGPTSLVGWKPILSDALAVHPLDVEEAVEDAKRKGVPTEFLPDGRPILASRGHRKAYLKAYGFHDKDGGYGD